MSLLATLGLGLALYVTFRLALALASKALRASLPEAVARAVVYPVGLSLLALTVRAWVLLAGATSESAATVDALARDGLVVGLVWLGAQVLTQLATRAYFERVRGVAVPGVVRRLVAGALYVAGALALLQSRFAWSAGDVVLLTSAAALAAGVVFQSALGGLLASLSLALSDALRVGDLVRVGEVEGTIEEIEARSAVLRATDGGHVILANRVLLDGPVVNFSRPARAHPLTFTVAASAAAPPNAVKACLAACARETPDVRGEPAPEALHAGVVDGAAAYRVTAWVDDYARRAAVEDGVRTRAWYRLRREGSAWPPAPPEPVDRAEVARLLARVPLLAPLSPEEVGVLAERASPVLYGAGEVIFRQGDAGESLYLVRCGEVRLSVDLAARDGSRTTREIATVEPGGSFGERSLVTGATRSARAVASVDAALLRIDRGCLRPVVMSNPAIVERLGDLIAAQDEQDRARVSAHERASDAPPRAERASVLEVIRAFFR